MWIIQGSCWTENGDEASCKEHEDCREGRQEGHPQEEGPSQVQCGVQESRRGRNHEDRGFREFFFPTII